MKFSDLDTFTRQYIVTALWSSNDNSDESGGEPLDENYDPSDIAEESLLKMAEDCRRFQEAHYDLIKGDLSQAGHDFWLTRNRHGAGFWECPNWEKEVGKILTDASHRFGESNLYIGNDGMIYAHP